MYTQNHLHQSEGENSSSCYVSRSAHLRCPERGGREGGGANPAQINQAKRTKSEQGREIEREPTDPPFFSLDRRRGQEGITSRSA